MTIQVNPSTAGVFEDCAPYIYNGSAWVLLDAWKLSQGDGTFVTIAAKMTDVSIGGINVIVSQTPPSANYNAVQVGGYFDPNGPEYTYAWTVGTGASFVGPSTTKTVTVQWSAGSEFRAIPLSVTVTETPTGTTASHTENIRWETTA